MGKSFHSYFNSIQCFSAAVCFTVAISAPSAVALEKSFPDLNRDSSFRDAVETALTEKQYTFEFQDSEGSSRRFVVDYDPSFFYANRARPEADAFRQYLSHAIYQAQEVKSFPYDRVEYHVFQKIRIPKVEEWETENGRKWEGNFDQWEGQWDEHIVPSFTFFLTAYDSEEEECDLQYRDEQGRIKMRYYIRVVDLYKKYFKQKFDECMESVSELNEYIEDAEYFKEEMIRSEFHGSESEFQEYLAALLVKRNSKLELMMGKKLFTSEVISHIRDLTGLPQHAIAQIMTERKANLKRF